LLKIKQNLRCVTDTLENYYGYLEGMELEKVLFVIVLYKQALKSSNAFQSLAPVIAEHGKKIAVFVYDNSLTPHADDTQCLRYIHDSSNAGVSRAYNAASVFAKVNGFKFLLLMDQDTHFPEKIFNSYSQAVAANPHIHIFAPVAKDSQRVYSPFRMIRGRGIALSVLKPGVHSLKDVAVINSGLLISLEAFERTGGYDERFPLDFSDINFCERLAENCFKIYLINESIVHHHSSSVNTEVKKRFDTYLAALVLFKKLSKQRISYWFAAFPRAAKLFSRSGDSWFLARFFKFLP
jgi:rhamnosyltransferase